MCLLAKTTEATSGLWQQVMQKCDDKRSEYSEDNKSKEDESKLDNLLCSFVINDDANIALRQLDIIFPGTWILKNSLPLFARWHKGKEHGVN